MEKVTAKTGKWRKEINYLHPVFHFHGEMKKVHSQKCPVEWVRNFYTFIHKKRSEVLKMPLNIQIKLLKE